MFEFMNEKCGYVGKKEFMVFNFNKETQKLQIVREDEAREELDIFKSKIDFNLDIYGNYEEKIYHELLKNGNVRFDILSTESGDNYDIYLHRNVTQTTKDSKLVTYTFIFNDKIIGRPIAIDSTVDEENFYDWINSEYEDIAELNNSYCWSSFNSIITAPCLSSEEEHNMLNELFYKQY